MKLNTTTSNLQRLAVCVGTAGLILVAVLYLQFLFTMVKQAGPTMHDSVVKAEKHLYGLLK